SGHCMPPLIVEQMRPEYSRAAPPVNMTFLSCTIHVPFVEPAKMLDFACQLAHQAARLPSESTRRHWAFEKSIDASVIRYCSCRIAVAVTTVFLFAACGQKENKHAGMRSSYIETMKGADGAGTLTPG
ncbi:MAG: hypothetical protein RIG67_16765, partial [Rhodospirillales bacterium]